MIHNQVYGMLFMLIVHVDNIASTKTKSKGFLPAARAFHPPRGSAGVDLPVFCKDML